MSSQAFPVGEPNNSEVHTASEIVSSQALPVCESSDLISNHNIEMSQEHGINEQVADITQHTAQPTNQLTMQRPITVFEYTSDENLVTVSRDTFRLMQDIMTQAPNSQNTHITSLNDLIARVATIISNFENVHTTTFSEDVTQDDVEMEEYQDEEEPQNEYTETNNKIALPLGLIVSVFDIVQTSTIGSSTVSNEVNAKAKITILALPRADGSFLLTTTPNNTTSFHGKEQQYRLHLQYEEVTALFACKIDYMRSDLAGGLAGLFWKGFELLLASHWDDVGSKPVEVWCGEVVDDGGCPLLKFAISFVGASDVRTIWGWGKRRGHGEEGGEVLSAGEMEVVASAEA